MEQFFVVRRPRVDSRCLRIVFSLELGVDMSPGEIAAYESKNIFFIPSFTSTSKTQAFKGKTALIHIDVTPEWSKLCMEILPEHTKYPEEKEILFSCYNLYKYLRTDKSNSQRIIKLQLIDYDRYFDYQRNITRENNDDDYYWTIQAEWFAQFNEVTSSRSDFLQKRKSKSISI